MLREGRKKTVASSSSSVSDKTAASKKTPSVSDYQHNKVMKVQEKFPSLVDIENEGEDGKEKGEVIDGGEKGDSDKEKGGKYGKHGSLEEESNVSAGVEGKAEGIQKLPKGFYEVEAIREKRCYNGQVQYLIKWRDYPEVDNTWEPYENIKYCTDMLETYEQSSQKHNPKYDDAHPEKKYPMQTEDGRGGITARTFGEDSSPLHGADEEEGEVKGKQKLIEDIYEDKAIHKKCYHNDKLQYLIKRHDYRETYNTFESYDFNNKYCADLLKASNQSSWTHKRKRSNTQSKKMHSTKTKDSRDDTNRKGREDISPLTPSFCSRKRGTDTGTTCSVKKDIIVYKRRQICSSEKDIIVYQRRNKLNTDSLDKKGKNIMKDQIEKEKSTDEEPTTNKVPAPFPAVKKMVEGMTNEKGRNFVMQDYVQKQRAKEEVKSGVGSTYFSIFFPNYKENIEKNGEAPPLPPFVRSMPYFYSPPQSQAGKASARLTGAKRRKSGHVRRFIHPDEEAKKEINAEVVDSTEAIGTPAAVDTATSSNIEKVTEKVQGSKLAFRSKPF